MPLASIQLILNVSRHPNADLLDVVQVLGYECIVRKGEWAVGDYCVFFEPDCVLPDQPWAAFYKNRSSRVKAIKLRNVWSFGVVEKPERVGYKGPLNSSVVGLNISEAMGVTKYEPPAPQDLACAGPYSLGIPKTDEERYQSIEKLPLGEVCDVTLKIDGQSFSAICKLPGPDQELLKAIGGRTMLYKLESSNNYTRNENAYGVINKLDFFCRQHQVSLCIRGEQYGMGIQKNDWNIHSKMHLSLAFFSTWMIDERRYARKGDPYYIFNIAKELELPTVAVLEENVVLTMELIRKYAEMELLDINGKCFGPFEGVVINWKGGSFKVINLFYDSHK